MCSAAGTGAPTAGPRQLPTLFERIRGPSPQRPCVLRAAEPTSSIARHQPYQTVSPTAPPCIRVLVNAREEPTAVITLAKGLREPCPSIHTPNQQHTRRRLCDNGCWAPTQPPRRRPATRLFLPLPLFPPTKRKDVDANQRRRHGRVRTCHRPRPHRHQRPARLLHLPAERLGHAQRDVGEPVPVQPRGARGVHAALDRRDGDLPRPAQVRAPLPGLQGRHHGRRALRRLHRPPRSPLPPVQPPVAVHPAGARVGRQHRRRGVVRLGRRQHLCRPRCRRKVDGSALPPPDTVGHDEAVGAVDDWAGPGDHAVAVVAGRCHPLAFLRLGA